MSGTATESMKMGRKPKDYKTKQVRMEKATADLLGRIAGLRGMDIPDLTLEWLKPLAEQEFSRCVRELNKELETKKKKGG